MGTAPIVDLRANVEPDVSTRSEPNTATGFSYILNASRLSCGRLARRTETYFPYRSRRRPSAHGCSPVERPAAAAALLGGVVIGCRKDLREFTFHVNPILYGDLPHVKANHPP